MKDKRKLCAFPNCTHIAQSRGKRETEKGFSQFKWCRFHRKGKGKEARLNLK